MVPFKFTLPPKTPGVYMFKHEPTGRVYIGSASNLHRRFQEWRSVINSGSYWKSGMLAGVLPGTKPEDWTFYVAMEFETIEQAMETEAALITGVFARKPEVMLNTRLPSERGWREPDEGAVALSIVRGDDGQPLSYRDAARQLDCRIETLEKRLAKWRGKGRADFTIAELRAISAGRPTKTIVTQSALP